MFSDAPITRLTPRQKQIVELLTTGMSNTDVALILSIKRDTVQRHIHSACEKLSLTNRVQLIVAFAIWKVRQDDARQYICPETK